MVTSIVHTSYLFKHLLIDKNGKLETKEFVLLRLPNNVLVKDIKKEVMQELLGHCVDTQDYWLVAFYDDIIVQGNYKRVDSDDGDSKFDGRGDSSGFDIFLVKPGNLDNLPISSYKRECEDSCICSSKCRWLGNVMTDYDSG